MLRCQGVQPSKSISATYFNYSAVREICPSFSFGERSLFFSYFTKVPNRTFIKAFFDIDGGHFFPHASQVP
jgi:hypothetical protein